jgi:hypothetical protein
MVKLVDSTVETLSRNGQTVGYETITPALATEYLNSMPGNRPLSNKQVEYLTQQAEAGKFFSNVAPLHFDTEGRLRNGQHRMWMVIESNRPQEFMVIRNATEEEIDALDIGKRRTGGDVLVLDGYENGTLLAGALVNLWMYEHGINPGYSRSFFNTKNAPGMTNHMMREYAALNPGMGDSVAYIKATPSVRLLGPPNIMTFCHFLTVKANTLQGIAFWDALASQVFWGQNDPAFRIHERLTRSKGGQRQNRLVPSEVAALLIKAWNFWVQGKGISQLRWQMPGSHALRGAEDFPRVRSK